MNQIEAVTKELGATRNLSARGQKALRKIRELVAEMKGQIAILSDQPLTKDEKRILIHLTYDGVMFKAGRIAVGACRNLMRKGYVKVDKHGRVTITATGVKIIAPLAVTQVLDAYLAV